MLVIGVEDEDVQRLVSGEMIHSSTVDAVTVVTDVLILHANTVGEFVRTLQEAGAEITNNGVRYLIKPKKPVRTKPHERTR